jgi:uncharacterized membrane protein YcaP (DUF421 family)
MNEALVVFERGIIGFFTLLIFARVLGRTQITQLTFFDYILGITIGSTASTLTTDLGSSAWPHWVGLATWVIAGLTMQWLSVKWRNVGRYLNGEPLVVIMNGKILETAMQKARYTIGDLLEQLRSKDVFDINQVEFAVLETDGEISVLKKSQFQPLTPKDMNIPTNYVGLSTEIIYNGIIIQKNLDHLRLDKDWLLTKLKEQNVNDPSDVFLATLNTDGTLYIDTYGDNVDNKIIK